MSDLPVIDVVVSGPLAVGKTCFVEWLEDQLVSQGHSVTVTDEGLSRHWPCSQMLLNPRHYRIGVVQARGVQS